MFFSLVDRCVFYDDSICSDDPLRGLKHVACIRLYNRYSIFQYCCVRLISIILFSTYTTGMAPLKCKIMAPSDIALCNLFIYLLKVCSNLVKEAVSNSDCTVSSDRIVELRCKSSTKI
jgi:uncharacterized membrane protein YobD (UPF0266 family)